MSASPAASPVSAALEDLTGAEDLRGLDAGQLAELAARIRAFLIDKVCATGGHLGVNLGVVELTLALHRVFDSPRDVLLFDTGHQAYVHKILTGRAGRFDTLRQAGGLSGYPSQAESPHDWVENSHASTALSYADGIAKALHLQGELSGARDGVTDGAIEGTGAEHAGDGGRRVVAVIGDGALTGGLAWEGLNNLAARPERPVIVVLNDNGRSYAATVGGIAAHLAVLRQHAGARVGGAPPDGAPPADKNLFEQLGLAYIGPVDGHDLGALERALHHAARLRRTVVVHAVTHKGRGYPPAEADQADHMHGIGVLDPATGAPARVATGPSWTSVFGREITQIAERRRDVVAVTAAMLHPVGLTEFAERFPERVFDVGIAEQQAVCSAAGLAMAGLHPVVCVYATFLNRAFDQVLMDVALHRLPVTFVLDRAGITGPDGASHHGMWDPSVLAVVPGLRLCAPRDPARLRELLSEAVDARGPTVLRFPKATAGTDIDAIGQVDGIDILYCGDHPMDVLIVSTGTLADQALAAAWQLNADGIGVTVIDPRWALPIPAAVVRLTARHRLAITLEDATRTGGIGSAITQACADAGVPTPVRNLGLPPDFLPAGDRRLLLERSGLTADAIAATVLDSLPAVTAHTRDRRPERWPEQQPAQGPERRREPPIDAGGAP
ncbi:1-deoxy-D-xylulose-5-phosphate synthase [Nonomuraea rosea]